VFRRRSSDAPDVAESDQAEPVYDPDADQQARSSYTPKKAGPTPKRSEAEANRRSPYRAPTDRKAAGQDSKERQRAERVRRSQALQRGEDWALPAKDRGPVRGLARDVVDSRRGLSEYYLIAVLPILVLIFIKSLQLAADAIVLAILIVVATEGYFIGRRVQRLVAERFPGQSVRGVRLYAGMRNTQLRRLRMPKPRVDVGDPV
jgi:hypothetical protein